MKIIFTRMHNVGTFSLGLLLFSIVFGMASRPFRSFSQDFVYANVLLKSVTFSSGNLSIRKDDGTGTFSVPQWVSTASVQNPVAYVSGAKPTAAAAFTINCASVPDSVWIRGTASDSISFPAVKVVVAASANTIHNISYPAKSGSKVFTAGVVRFFKPFSIHWEISFDNGQTWRNAGTSANTLYVTRIAPQSENGNFQWFHTVFDISCRNAQYQSTDTGIISNCWNEFIDHVVLNYNGDSLFYYKSMNSPNVTLATLLKYRDAECYTFAQLFLSLLKIQGIVRTNNYIFITPAGNTVCGGSYVDRFIVKNWQFGTPTGSCPDFPYVNTYTNLIPAPYTSYVFTKAEVTDQAGIYGSCTVNPSSYFNNHQITLIDDTYYDPCYGVTFKSVTDIPAAAFSGWSYRQTISSTTYCYFTSDLSKSSLTTTVSTW